MLVWVHQSNAVLVEHAFVALDHDLQIALVLERDPSAAIGEYVAVGGARHMERSLHPPLNRFVPRAVEFLHFDASVLVPEHQFKKVGSRVIPTRYESRCLVLDSVKRLRNILRAFDASWIALWPDQHKVVVHNRMPLHAVSFGDERLFGRFGMYKHNISIAAPCRAPDRCRAPHLSGRWRSSV